MVRRPQTEPCPEQPTRGARVHRPAWPIAAAPGPRLRLITVAARPPAVPRQSRRPPPQRVVSPRTARVALQQLPSRWPLEPWAREHDPRRRRGGGLGGVQARPRQFDDSIYLRLTLKGLVAPDKLPASLLHDGKCQTLVHRSSSGSRKLQPRPADARCARRSTSLSPEHWQPQPEQGQPVHGHRTSQISQPATVSYFYVTTALVQSEPCFRPCRPTTSTLSASAPQGCAAVRVAQYSPVHIASDSASCS